MTHYIDTPDYAHGTPACSGILLTNLGTPDAPTTSALRRYLAEFLADPRVVEAPRFIWMLMLWGVILWLRPPRSAKAYRKVWTDEGSPLLVIARQQAEAVQRAMNERFPGLVHVALGMRYGKPSIKQALRELKAANAQRILVLPLYPQYSASATASTFDAVSKELGTWRWVPELRMVQHYHDFPAYIQALADSIREYRAQHGASQLLLFSFHGVPKRYLLNGDPYHCECYVTARLVAENLGLEEHEWQLAFQSRFGREEWLKPYTDHVLTELPDKGIKSVDVVCPGFSADCLETLEEIAMQDHGLFIAAGGERFEYIPALNDRADHITAIAGLIAEHCSGWPETTMAPDTDALNKTRERALSAGTSK